MRRKKREATMNPIEMMSEEQFQQCRHAFDGGEAGFGRLSTEKGNLPLASVDVQAAIVGLLSEVRLTQTFQNSHAVPLEATYIFPLPDRAAVTSFVMTVNGRRIEGLLQERAEARQQYDAAIAAGQRAAIAEEERPGTFSLRVGNLLPKETAAIELVMTHSLPLVDGEATFHFPLLVAPRYIPGQPLPGESVGEGTALDTDAVPDASRITPPVLLPGFPNPVLLSVSVTVDPAGLPLTQLASSLHAVSESFEAGKHRIAIQPGARINRDFVLRLSYGDEALPQSSLSVEPDPDGQGGTFALTLLAPTALAKTARPRDVIFLLDRSGSMRGWKMVASRRACARMLDTLTDKDRFTVYAFDNLIDTPPAFAGRELRAASDRNRFAAIEFLAGVDARGGTELAQPLSLALAALAAASGERERILVLITDGQVGNEDQILRSFGKQTEALRIFTVGVDSAVNAGFLRRFAALGGGACELVESEERLDAAMDRLHRRIAAPALSELKVEPAGLKLVPGTLVPARLPALFAGAPLVITGRFEGQANDGGLTVGGTDPTGSAISRTLAPSHTQGRAIAQTWARGRLRDLEDRWLIERNPGLERQILDVSLRYQVLCRFTAFVAVDASEAANPGGARQHLVQPVESPDWGDLGRGTAVRRFAAASVGGAVPGGATRGRVIAQSVESMLLGQQGTGTGKGGWGPAVAPAPAAARFVARGPSSPPTDESPVALTSYRLRAAELAEQLRTATEAAPSEATRSLLMMLVKLRELIEDLASVGAEEEALQLGELREHLTASLAAPAPAVAEILAEAMRGLSVFASAPAEAAPSKGRRGWKFWK